MGKWIHLHRSSGLDPLDRQIFAIRLQREDVSRDLHPKETLVRALAPLGPKSEGRRGRPIRRELNLAGQVRVEA